MKKIIFIIAVFIMAGRFDNEHLKNVSPEQIPTNPKFDAMILMQFPNRDQWNSVHKYIDKFLIIAKEEEQRTGIPAAITLAQGILESGAGKGTLARKGNNHFGIKCFKRSCKKKHQFMKDDEQGLSRFRTYDSAEQSFRDHSAFLEKKRYRNLFCSNDLRKWCKGLQSSGYATDSRYWSKLYNIVKKYNLDKI